MSITCFSITFVSFIWFVLFKSVSCNECGSGPTTCPENMKYRSFDGSCNNLDNPLWGSAGSVYGRLFPAKFSDGKILI